MSDETPVENKSTVDRRVTPRIERRVAERRSPARSAQPAREKRK